MFHVVIMHEDCILVKKGEKGKKRKRKLISFIAETYKLYFNLVVLLFIYKGRNEKKIKIKLMVGQSFRTTLTDLCGHIAIHDIILF